MAVDQLSVQSLILALRRGCSQSVAVAASGRVFSGYVNPVLERRLRTAFHHPAHILIGAMCVGDARNSGYLGLSLDDDCTRHHIVQSLFAFSKGLHQEADQEDERRQDLAKMTPRGLSEG